MKEYGIWIRANVPQGRGCYGKCKQYAEEMLQVFPHLKLVRGHYYCQIWGERAHWWLVTETGLIVDPTSSQFPSCGMGEYVEWDESQPEPTGKCPNCGGYCYNGEAVCSERCHEEYAAYCSRGFI